MLMWMYLRALDKFNKVFIYYRCNISEKLFCKNRNLFCPSLKSIQNVQFIQRFFIILSLCVYYDLFGLRPIRAITCFQCAVQSWQLIINPLQWTNIYFKSHLWQMKREPIKTPFLSKSKESDYHDSLAIFKLILRFMNDTNLSGRKEKVRPS